jgi:hypothetical protein
MVVPESLLAKYPKEIFQDENLLGYSPSFKKRCSAYDFTGANGGYHIHGLTRKHMMAIAMLKHLYDVTHEIGLSLLITVDGRHRCLGKGDRVILTDGSWKNVEDVAIGDFILSPQLDGTVIPSKVLSTHKYLEKEVYDVMEPRLTNKKLYTCSGNHTIPLVQHFSKRLQNGKRKHSRIYKEYTAKYISTLKNAKRSRVVTFSTPPLTFNKPDSTINPYLLGVWLGDGHCGVTEVGITTNDEEIKKAIHISYPGEVLQHREKIGTTAETITITKRGKFYNELKRLGLCRKNSGTKFIPTECLTSSIPYRINLLAGLTDTDGFVPKNTCHIEITTKSNELAEGIMYLVHSLGGNGRINIVEKGIKKLNFMGKYYVVRFAFKTSSKIMEDFISAVQVKRKKERLVQQCVTYAKTNNNHLGYDPRHIAIECVKTHPQEVYGFELDSPSGLFITNDWLVTHNTGKSRFWVTVGCIMDNVFEEDMEHRIITDAESLMNVIKEIDSKKQHHPFLMIDEAGAALASGDWYERMQKAIIKTLTIIGYLHPTIVFITTNEDLILSGVRKQTHMHIEMRRSRNKYAYAKFYNIRINPVTRKRYKKKPIVRFYGEKVYLDKIIVPLPPKHIDDRYAAIEATRKPRLLQEIYDDVIKAEMKDLKELFDPDKAVDTVVKRYQMFQTRKQKEKAEVGDDVILDEGFIKLHLKIKHREAKLVKEMAETVLNGKGVVQKQIEGDEKK